MAAHGNQQVEATVNSNVKANVRTRFDGDLSQPVPIPEQAIAKAVEIMRSGRLHRYDETKSGGSEVAALEQEFAQKLSRRYCIGLNSGGCAIFVALKAAGLEPGEIVLTNAFTLAPVPGAIAHAGAIPRFVGSTENLTIDLAHLEAQIEATRARFLLLSHMRGHLADLMAISEICERHNVKLIEDCAHTWGAEWDGRPTGTFGIAGCFSAQSFKHMNAGESGLLVCDDAQMAARAIMLSGSYMFYHHHKAAPDPDSFQDIRLDTPNCSMRMTELAAALLRPQLGLIEAWRTDWNFRHDHIANKLKFIPHLILPERPSAELYVGSSLQFLVTGLADKQTARFVDEAGAHGVHLKWFGNSEPAGFTSRYPHWRYAGQQPCMSASDRVLSQICDMRIPLGLPLDDCDTIVNVISDAMDVTLSDL